MHQLAARSADARSGASRGFTLVEFALSIVLIALIIGGLLIPLGRQIETVKLDETRRLLEQAKDALLAYAAAIGYFPCPANDVSNGREAAGTDHTTGACPDWYGFLPAATLGFTPINERGYATDAWLLPSNRIRYAVSAGPVGGIENPFTRTEGLRTIPVASLPATALFYICDSGLNVNAGADCGTARTLTSNAAIVLWSIGPTGAAGGTSVHEAQNPHPTGGSADRIFVSRAFSDVAGNEFDDVLVWISASTIVDRLSVSGHITRRVYSGSSPK